VQAADSGESAAKSLKNKTVFLRQMYAEDDLTFDPQGNATGKATSGSFYLSAVRVDKVHLSNAQVALEGHRQLMISPLKANAQSSGDIHFLEIAAISIVMQRDKEHLEALSLALQKIFALSIDAELADKSPEQKQALLESAASLQPPSDLPKTGVYKVGGDIAAPKLIQAVDPEFSDKARLKKFGGICVISFIVDASGFPTHLRVQQSTGMIEQDEKVIEAVSQYIFEPATIQGKPVPVQTSAEVAYRIY